MRLTTESDQFEKRQRERERERERGGGDERKGGEPIYLKYTG